MLAFNISTWKPLGIDGFVLHPLFLGPLILGLNTTAYTYLPKEQNNYATGLYNLLRNEGGSVGTSLAVTLLIIVNSRRWVHYAGAVK